MSEVAPEIQRHYYDVERGTEFDKDRSDLNYWLGPVIGFREIAEYGFVEYREVNFRNGPEYGRLTGRTRFSIYINGHRIGSSGTSLDHAPEPGETRE